MKDFNVNVPVDIPQEQMVASLIRWMGLDYLLGDEEVEIKPEGDDLLYKMPSEPEDAWRTLPEDDQKVISALSVIVERLSEAK